MQTISDELSRLQVIELDAGQIFSGNPSGTPIKGYATPSLYTPRLDPNYLFHESSRDIIVWLLSPEEPLYIFGPSGCGKTSCVKQLAARLNYPLFEVTGHGRLEFADLTGHLTVHEGSMSYEYGPLALAMRYGGICLINELDMASPEVAAGLHGILDGSPLCIPENGGELIIPHPMFRFVATANTNGAGDDTGLYQGTQRQNLAFTDRFILCEMGYPDSSVEKKLLRDRYPTLPVSLCETMVDYANEVRRLFMGEMSGSTLSGSIEITFSTRSLLRWGALTLRFQPLAKQGIQPVTYALDRALAYRASRETRAMLHELAQRMFPHLTGNGSDLLMGEEALGFVKLHSQRSSAVPYPRIFLRKEYVLDGQTLTKDWVGDAGAEGLTITWGHSGQSGQQHFVPVDTCKDKSPILELTSRAAKKLREGYALIKTKSSI